MSIEARSKTLVEEFRAISDWETRYKKVIEWGKQLPTLNMEELNDRFLIEGCVSKAWLIPERNHSMVCFKGESEAAIVKGILALLIHVYSNSTPAEIIRFQPEFLSEIGLAEHLSMNRRNGMSQVVKQMKLYATVFSAQDRMAPTKDSLQS
jgi:cysteine desulfuration protein SufE